MRSAILIAFVLTLVACTKPAETQLAGDLSAQAASEIIAADTAFNQMAQDKGAGPAFAEYMDATDGMMIVPGGDPIRGHDAIFEAHNDGLVPSPLVWKPEQAFASKVGDFGASWGKWAFNAPGADGKPVHRTGKYVTVWRKNADGAWKGLMDTGVSDPATPPAPASASPAPSVAPAEPQTPAPSSTPDAPPATPEAPQSPPEIMEPPGPSNPGGSGNQ